MADNTAIARRWFREVWVEGGESAIDELMAPDSTAWMEGRVVSGRNEFKEVRAQLLEVFPDLVITADDIIEQHDKVAVRWTVRATHMGNGLGLTPTRRTVSFRGMTWMEFQDGRIVRGWDSWNMGGLIQSLGGSGAVGPH